MAASRSKKSTSKKSASSASSAPLISTRRKMEVLGLVLTVFALLLSLAFLTYQPADDPIAAQMDLTEAIADPGANQAQFRVRNALGLVGAEMARVMVPGFLGYTVLLLTGLLGAWGVAIFRHRPLRRLLYASGLTVIATFVLACLIGWFGHVFAADLSRFGGAVGMGVAGWMQRVFGSAGSFILLLLSVTVTLLLVVDHDVQRSIDRVVDALHALRDAVRSRLASWKNQHMQRREERSKARRAAQQEQAERRKQREERRTTEENEREAAEAEPASAPSGDADAVASSPPPEPTPRPAPSADAEPSGDTAPPSESDGDASPTDSSDASPSASADASPPRAATPPPPLGDAVRRNDLFRGRFTQPETDSDASSETTSPDASADASAPDPPAPSEATSRRLETQELNLDELEAEFSEAFDEAEDWEAPEGGVKNATDDPAAKDREDESADAEADAEEPTVYTLDMDDDTSTSGAKADSEADVDVEMDLDDATPVDAGGAKDSSTDPAPQTADDETDEDDDVELRVQEQVEEETAEDIDRRAQAPEEIEYQPPSLDLLDEPSPSDSNVDLDELEENKRILLDKLKTYNIDIQDIKAVVGPTVTRYELTPAPGIKVSRIKSLEDDLAMAMAAQGIRMIAPIPGKSAVGVEIPNRNRELVRLRSVLGTAKFRDTDMELPIPLGKSIEGEVFLTDLAKCPHLLIAGATGSGKSVGLNTLITGLLYACHPASLKFVIIDPKKIELQQYTHLKDHFMARPEDLDEAVITDVDEALGVLKSCEKEMENRYDLLSEARVRGIQAYNRKFREGKLPPEDGHQFMPYIVVVVDELADLMMTAGKEIEGPIARLAQMARAVGIHLVLATQRPSVDVITGLIKANFPSRIAYEVASRVDSRTILDQIGAEGLVGNGDLLFQSGSKMVRLQGPFVSVGEVERIVDFVADQPSAGEYTLPSLSDAGHGPDITLGVEDTDELFEKGARVIVRRQQGSVSLLQRKLAVGYTRAARIVDQLEEAGIVGPFNGTKAREVMVEDEDELEALLNGDDEE